MPIKPFVLQQRHAELGRIRLGHKAETSGGKSRPAKLDKFRFTSGSERHVRDLAELYGGEPRPWDNAGKPEFEVFTEATTIPVMAVKNGMSQWLETWSGGGCIHRCDGEINALTGEPCDLAEKVRMGRDTVNPHEIAKPTTRLSVMLTELEAVGVWRLETHGWNAAAELPAVAELAAFVGPLVPAHLILTERRAIRDGKTSRFVVPVLDLQVGQARLREIAASTSGGGAPEVSAPASVPALEAPAPVRDWHAEVASATNVGQVQALWREANTAGQLDEPLREAMTARAEQVKGEVLDDMVDRGAVSAKQADKLRPPAPEPQPAPAPEPEPDADGAVPASTSEEEVWEQVVKAAGKQGLTLTELSEDFKTRTGAIPDEASLAELQSYLHTLTTGEVA